MLKNRLDDQEGPKSRNHPRGVQVAVLVPCAGVPVQDLQVQKLRGQSASNAAASQGVVQGDLQEAEDRLPAAVWLRGERG